MEVFKSETREILRRYLTGEIGCEDCVTSLDAAVAGLISFLKPEDLPEVVAVMNENTATLATEMKRRRSAQKTNEFQE